MKTALLSAMLAAAVTLAGSVAASAEPSAAVYLGDTGLRLPVSTLTAPEAPPTTVQAAPATPHAALPRKVRVVLASPYAVR
ncbi:MULTISPECIES: hypothetical protein [Methylobacterium]|uniref:Uncharacterized protein n=2 Tax=Methylobacterium TaxID=407 RepID=A0ABR5HI93_9HYPH|nr:MULTISPECIES: hypothetical protein [Methylobacterium]KMO11418.1 hypothetical protein QR78_28545 [Methylobacterium indicum]KMO26389.1 hypothetical protein QR79_02740 [Methylobacterium indicum]TNC09070.1 hypothetical protein FF100_27595 [Methylobacterium terricola]